jgi:hypothetical protein
MGIQAEYCPELVLANIKEFKEGRREKDECIPPDLWSGQIHNFLKDGQRHYWLDGHCPLIERLEEDKSKLDKKSTAVSWGYSKPRASIQIIEVTHFLKGDKVWSRGKYKVIEIFTDDKIYFEGFWRTE